MEHFTVTFKPEGKKVLIHAGATLIEAAGRAGIILNTTCGGKGICKKCLVTLEPQKEPVLACQYHIREDITVTIPPEARFYETKILAEGIAAEAHIHPAVCKRFVRIDSADPQTLQEKLNTLRPNESFQIEPAAVSALMRLTDPVESGLTAVCHLAGDRLKQDSSISEYDVVSVEPGDTTDELFGLAIDIGTTTVVAKLIDLTLGRCLATKGAANPQTKYGDDVISRINYAKTEVELAELQKTILDCVNLLAKDLCDEAAIDCRHIYEAVVVGNTTMNHIFLKLPIEQLGRAPYSAFSLDAADIRAARFTLDINPAANIHTVENVAGFVGSDTVAAALAVGIDSARETTLLVDIGTNGEIVLTAGSRLYAASCAAGPAFEGARISCGSRAIPGAIQTVILNVDDIDLDIIDDGPPSSICGSGLIDAVAVLLELGIVDETGRFVDPQNLKSSISAPLFGRIIEHNNQPAFVLARNDNNDNKSVILTQQDIRETQLAKAAIGAGVRILLRKIGLVDSDIKHVLLAGAFGNYIKSQSALRIGLLPDIAPERIIFVGNAASSGAEMALLSRRYRTLAGNLARKMKYLEIAHEPDFADIYADAMRF